MSFHNQPARGFPLLILALLLLAQLATLAVLVWQSGGEVSLYGETEQNCIPRLELSERAPLHTPCHRLPITKRQSV